MTIHEFGQVHDEVVVLVHPSVVMWDYFEYVIPLMQEHYHLIVPALPGYDTESGSDFTSVEQIAEELAEWLITHDHREIACFYGCSMGGTVVTRFLADRKVKVRSAVIDGGITPYQLPLDRDEIDRHQGFPPDFHGESRRSENPAKSLLHRRLL